MLLWNRGESLDQELECFIEVQFHRQCRPSVGNFADSLEETASAPFSCLRSVSRIQLGEVPSDGRSPCLRHSWRGSPGSASGAWYLFEGRAQTKTARREASRLSCLDGSVSRDDGLADKRWSD
jgi:hypothetical protein